MSASFHRLAALGLLALVLAAGYWSVQRYWFGTYDHYRDNLEQIQSRIQRYNSMLAMRPELERQLQEVQTDHSVDTYYLSEDSPTLAATRLQQQVRQAVESNGGNIISTQILPTASEGLFTRVAIKVQMTGDTDAVQKMLYSLEASSPLLFVDNMQIRARTIRQRATHDARRSARDRRARARQAPAEIKTHVQLTTQFDLAGYMRNGDV